MPFFAKYGIILSMIFCATVAQFVTIFGRFTGGGSMEEEKSFAERIRDDYGKDIERLSAYIPYFEARGGKDVADRYDGKYGKSSLQFPVYDATLLKFVNDAAQTGLMDRNYLYGYRRARISTAEQEAEAVAGAQLKDIDLLRSILSMYVLEGRYKSMRWIEGADRRVFLNVLIKLKELLGFSTVR